MILMVDNSANKCVRCGRPLTDDGAWLCVGCDT